MDDATLYSNFYTGLAIAAVIIVAAAVLLILVVLAARRILRLATVALGLVEQIKENTDSIWHLRTTNKVASDISDGADAIDSHAGLVVKALQEADKD
jgi:hypothetical protein